MKDLLTSGEASKCCVLVTFITFVPMLTAESCCRHVMLVICGLCSFTSISLLYCSVQLIPLSDSVVSQFLSPIMVALAAPLLLHEMPSRCAR